MFKFDTLENRITEEIVETFNTAFSDYFFPMKFTKEQFERKLFVEGGRLDLSVGAFKNDKLIAFILHFADKKSMVYNGGTGVVPDFRGNNLTSKMYEFIKPKLIANKFDTIILEVLTQNLSAIKTYQNQGFKITRELNCFKGKLKSALTLNIVHEIVELKEINWNLAQTFWDYTPTWQNSIQTVNNLKEQNVTFCIKSDDKILGYLIYNPNAKRIHQLAVHKDYRNQGLAQLLLDAVSQIDSENSIINVDSRDEVLIKFLEKNGLNNYTNQYEMELRLRKN
jgi:ribosomal protein S18 acetylase RimI-like enzyme